MITISQRGVKIRIVQSVPSAEFPDFDTQQLSMMGAAEVRNINFTAFEGSGILHTKLMIVDQQHFYVGSANMDWRSLTQVNICIMGALYPFMLYYSEAILCGCILSETVSKGRGVSKASCKRSP